LGFPKVAEEVSKEKAASTEKGSSEEEISVGEETLAEEGTPAGVSEWTSRDPTLFT
jgi:hypothetical protein